MTTDPLLWRCYTAIDEFLEALNRVAKNDHGMGLSAAFLAVINDHYGPLWDAVDAVKAHERRDAEATGDAHERIWGPPG